jgi:hypothetical protein
MKHLLYICFSLLFSTIGISQTVYRLNSANNGATITFSCPINNSVLADDGNGSTHYSNNIDYSITFCAPANKLLKFNFGCGSNTTIERIHPSDTLFIYDGNSTSSPLLYKVTGNPANSNRLTYFGESSSAIFTSPNSCITFRLKSGSSNNEDGWEACITCVDPISCGSGNSESSDLFLGAPNICNLNNYCGQTSGDFGADYPVNLNLSGGGCPSGLNFLGTIENNSWLKFQAAATSASFVFNVPLGGSCLNGIQTAIFSYNGTSLTRMTPCANSDGSWAGTFTLSTNSPLVPGNDYYLMIDGNAGDVCNYNVSASTGIAVANAGIDIPVCTNTTSLLASAGSGTWTVVGGTGVFSNPNSNATDVIGLTASTNIFQWSINTSNCGVISDEVTVEAGCLLPVELVRFDGECIENKISLSWETASEKNNVQFNVERSLDGVNFFSIGSVKGRGNSDIITNYNFIDNNNQNLLAYYRLNQIDYNGKINPSKIISVEKNCSENSEIDISLYPNPSNNSTTLSLRLLEESAIHIEIYNSLGQYVNSISLKRYEAGLEEINIDSTEFPTGLYFIKTTVNQIAYINKFLKQ